MVIVSGGDGILSAAASALVRTCIPLGVILRGTANAFARALGIPVTIEAVCQTILNGCTRVVDAARCGNWRWLSPPEDCPTGDCGRTVRYWLSAR
jgi:diacylglycerol kinase family enzyme